VTNTSVRIDLWDVGQGDCSVITLPSGELIIIDTGPTGSPIVSWLERNPSLIIYAIILTHNDSDHVGALTPILALSGRVKNIFALFETQRSKEEFNAIFRLAYELHNAGKVVFDRLESPKTIWSDPAIKTELRVAFPDTVDIQLAGCVNKSSAIIELVANDNTVAVWPGDNTVTQVSKKISQMPVHLLHGPHHGAPLDLKNKAIDPSLDQIKPAHVFVSVGTKNTYNHPQKKYLDKLVSRQVQVTCSQLNRLCDRKTCLAGKPVFDSASRMGLWPNPHGVACRGCMRFTLSDGVLQADSFVAEHRRRIEKLHAPMCL
jgi:beta-lactamase superfamily II metal-dependent hydrolase